MGTITVERDLMVPMRDGVCLATDVYRPADEGQRPVLVHRIPYNKSIAHYIGSQMLNPIVGAERGYVVVVQDCRGCYASEGVMTPYRQEAGDGFDTVEWAAEQAWSNGRVGIYGSSYMGITCLQAALAAPPHLEAAVAYLTGTNLYQGWVYSGGALELGFNMGYSQGKLLQAVGRLGLDESTQQRLMREFRESNSDRAALCEYLPLSDAPVLREREVLPDWHDYLEHDCYDDYWHETDVVGRAAEINAPILHIAGWYDQFLKGHLDLNLALQDHPVAGLRDAHRFIIGPWDHNSYEGHRLTWAGERNFGGQALSGVMGLGDTILQWFDHWLKDRDTPLMKEPSVRYFMMGDTNEWIKANRWPPPNKPTRFFLHSGGMANSRLGDGILSRDEPGDQPADTYCYDPENPVPTVGGRTFSLAAGESGVQDQSEVEEREDVLVYSSQPLERALQIAGNVRVRLWIASDGPDTDFTGKLVDVEPGGYCAVVADGIMRARFRDPFEQPSFLVPGEPTELEIDLWDVAYTFKAGHAIRLEVSSSSFPRFSRNANGLVSPERALPEDLRVAQQTVFHDGQRPSHLVLPVIDSE